jgi:hypothetical protein
MPVTVPQLPLAVVNVMVPALLICDGVVEPPVIEDHPLEDVTATRAYEPPETSVPVKDALASVVGFVVNSPIYRVVGAAPHAPDDGHVTPLTQLSTLF